MPLFCLYGLTFRLGEEKARLLFMEEGAGERNEKKTTRGVAWQKPFLLSVTRLGALPCGAPVPGGMKALISVLLGVPSVAMVARSLWSVCRSRKSSGPCSGHQMSGALMQPPGPPWMKKKTTKTWSAWGGKVAISLKGEGPRASLSRGFC